MSKISAPGVLSRLFGGGIPAHAYGFEKTTIPRILIMTFHRLDDNRRDKLDPQLFKDWMLSALQGISSLRTLRICLAVGQDFDRTFSQWLGGVCPRFGPDPCVVYH